jgi:MFS family permease
VLDGLEATLAGSVAGALKASPILHFSDSDVGLASSLYLAGAVSGSLFFGWLADWLGRRLLFFVTLGIYIVAAVATAFSWDLASFCLFRFFTGAGIGGEYSAVNSTIQEMIPARFRGWTNLALGGTYWIGGALGSGASIVFLNPANINPETGWRLGFFIGAVLSLIVLFLRSWIPESPRWLVVHGREDEAEKIAGNIEAGFHARGVHIADASNLKPMKVHPRTHTPLNEVFRTIFVTYRTRALVGLVLMGSQAFFYNAIFFTYALILTKFYAVPAQNVG